MADVPLVSVIVCTHNPPPRLLAWALRSLDEQTLPATEFEVIVIDSGSEPPLDRARLPLRRGATLHRERQPGLSRARVAGIRLAHASLLVFVDDDNSLAPDYLANAVAIAAREPGIGAFGGKAMARVPVRIPAWKRGLLDGLGVRDEGDQVITASTDEWGPWEPMGAGMAVRADVAAHFASFPGVTTLGRTGTGALSGDDSLLARLAYRHGYACSYQPSLRLTHAMKRDRLRTWRLARTYYGHGVSAVILERLLGRQVPRPGVAELARELSGRLWRHLRTHGLRAGLVRMCWDIGYYRQARTSA